MITDSTLSKMALRIYRNTIRQFSKQTRPAHYDLSLTQPVLIGRDIITPIELSQQDMHSLLWTALDLKTQAAKSGLQNAFKRKFLENRTVNFLSSSSEPHLEGSLLRAVVFLGGALSVTHLPYFEKGRERACRDLGKLMSTTSDIMVVRSNEQAMVEEIADGALIPVVAAKTDKFSILMGLADMMTVYEKFRRLEGLTMGWVGPPQAMFNTYLTICPRLGINFKFHSCVTQEFEASPTLLNVGMQNCIRFSTELHDCTNAKQAIYRSDIVATSGTDCDSFTFGLQHTREAAVKWVLLHELPRGKAGVSDQVFCSKNNFCWESHANLTWVAMAVILRLFEDVLPCTAKPTFENL